MKHASSSSKQSTEAESRPGAENSQRAVSVEAPASGVAMVDRLVQRRGDGRPADSSSEGDAGGVSLRPPRSGIDFVDRDGGAQLQRMADGRAASTRLDEPLPVQRVGGERSSGGDARRIRQIARGGLQGGGARLPYLSRIQRSFGAHDISGVRSFTGARAAAASRAIQAKAYASGDKIAFAKSTPSLHTVAHEAAHVVQQRAGVRLPGGVGRAGDRHERHADAVADKVVQGKSAERSLDAYFSGAGTSGGDAGVQRTLDGELKDDVDTKKSATKQYDLRYATIIETLTERVDEDEHLSLNPDAVIAPMIYRLENHDDVTYETYRHLINALKARGAILIDGEESGLRAPKQTEKALVINLLLPGSGDRRWRTFSENMIGSGIATRKDMFREMDEVPGNDSRRDQLGVKKGKRKFPTFFEYTGDTTNGVTYMIRGPGLTDSTSSHPSNNISSNIKTATAIVESFLQDWSADNVEVRIMGHSRNGVTASRLTQTLKTSYPELEIEAVIFDPVPGGDANMFGSYDEETLSESEDVNSTVIYSLMDTRPGFNPMKVYGAKRLILTHYSHHAGIEAGFTYEKQHYKGLGLLDLPEGLFIDSRVSPGTPNNLMGPIDDWETIKIVWTVAKMEKKKKNKNRLARVRKVVETFLGTESEDQF